jgi:hypothetical protein
MSRTNYIFVDFENVQETDLDRVADKPVKVTFVLGAQHKNLPVPLVKRLLKHAGQVELVETGRSGRNALDLVLAERIGEARHTDPHGYFHIVSKDTDFEALIGHLRDNGTLAQRRAGFHEIPVLMTPAERVASISRHFEANPVGRPKKRKALESQIQAVFGKALSEAELDETIKGLIQNEVIVLAENGDIAYRSRAEP